MFEKKNKTRHRVAESDGPIVPTIWPAAGRFTTTWKQLIESDVGPKPVEPRNRMATEPFGAIDSMPKGQRPFSQPKTVINVRMHLYYPQEKKTMNTHCSVSSSQRLMFLSTREQVSYQIHNDLLLLAQPGKPDLNHLAGRRPRDAMDPVRAFQSAMFHSLFFFSFPLLNFTCANNRDGCQVMDGLESSTTTVVTSSSSSYSSSSVQQTTMTVIYHHSLSTS